MAYLRHIFNGQTASIYKITVPFTIGRDLKNNLVIDDPLVSAFHAEIASESDKWFLVDAKSTNGVYVNGRKTEKAQLEQGMVITLGAHELAFETEEPKDFSTTLTMKKSWIPGVFFAR